ncbi:hypothetical protein [Paraburkholderia youngii]|uniref:Uncharacterized protein n=1 Tax=Paraburkholderia youngii TaxID=2782701 RepID=A0A7Y6K4P0_9BURK|nr:hypothetical protein [Paraburkholderia youngii]NUY03861.1 hypothetical protein [Paraburkholderia youngii]
MFDGFWSGVFGGLFGSAVMRWARKYRYTTIFLIVTIAVYIFSFVQDLVDVGGPAALARLQEFTFTPIGLLVPMGIGLLAVLCVFVCATFDAEKKE